MPSAKRNLDLRLMLIDSNLGITPVLWPEPSSCLSISSAPAGATPPSTCKSAHLFCSSAGATDNLERGLAEDEVHEAPKTPKNPRLDF